MTGKAGAPAPRKAATRPAEVAHTGVGRTRPKVAPAGAKVTAARVDALEQTVAKQREDIDVLTWLLADLLGQIRKGQAKQIAAKLAPALQAQIEQRLAAGLPLA